MYKYLEALYWPALVFTMIKKTSALPYLSTCELRPILSQ